MLWNTKNDLPKDYRTLEAFVDWLETHNPNETYIWEDVLNCPAGRYREEKVDIGKRYICLTRLFDFPQNGFPISKYRSSTWPYHYITAALEKDHNGDLCFNRDKWNYGEAAKRGREVLASVKVEMADVV